GSHLRNLHQHSTQCFRGANDLLEHGRTYDFFAQRNVFVQRPVLGPLSIIDVGSRRIPAHDLPIFVQKWVVSDQEPAVLAVCSEGSLLVFKGNPSGKRVLSYFAKSRNVLRVEDARAKIVGSNL